MAGFFLSGVLSALLGAILPAWGYHLTSSYLVAGGYFLSIALGVIVATELARRLMARRGSAFVLTISAALACAALVFLAFVCPPFSSWLRTGGLFALGLATGGLNTGLCHAALPLYRQNSAAAMNLAGIVFGSGNVAVALMVSGVFYVYTVPSILGLIAVLPGLLIGLYARTRWAAGPTDPEPTFREALRDFRSFGAVLFALILFFQFGNEWSVGGWLPIFLIQRIGMSPTASLLFLALYWTSLLIGRGIASYLIPRVHHGKLLLFSALGAMFGCLILIQTNNQFGVTVGILFVGGGFAPVYPLIAEKIGDRYRYFRPGFFNGIFSFALTGGMLAPFSLGVFAESWGVGVIMGLPLIGTCIVVVLLLLLWLEARLRG